MQRGSWALIHPGTLTVRDYLAEAPQFKMRDPLPGSARPGGHHRCWVTPAVRIMATVGSRFPDDSRGWMLWLAKIAGWRGM